MVALFSIVDAVFGILVVGGQNSIYCCGAVLFFASGFSAEYTS